MPDIKFDEKLQPVIHSGNDAEYVTGREEFEQHLRLVSIDRLFGTLERYNQEDVKGKIGLTVRRIAREQDYLDRIHNIKIERVEDEQQRRPFKVYVEYVENGSFEFSVDDT